jgi:hypothetical protein
MDQSRQNTRSTKIKTHDNEPLADPCQEPNNAITNQIFATVEETGRIYTDQTGQFPAGSSNGYQYMLVMYHYDTNGILVTPQKTQHGNEILRGYTKLYEHLHERGFKPTTQWLDNEASNALKTFNRTQAVEYQLVPPHVHRRNSAERAICTWKNHFVAGICSTDTAFPLHLWDRLIDQATITLNLLRPAWRNPNMSAHQMLNGTFDYNQAPMAPPGTKIVVHEMPAQRRIWDPHGVDGWYVRPATEHYRCYCVFINKTRSERITATVEFFPQDLEMTYPTPTEIAVDATKTLIRALQNPTPFTPFAHQPFDRITAIRTIADIFQPYSTPGIIPHLIEEEPVVDKTNTRVVTPTQITRVATPTQITRVATPNQISRVATPNQISRVATPTQISRVATPTQILRVATPTKPTFARRTSPRVAIIEQDTHRYPRRNIIHSANLVTTVQCNNHEHNVDLAFLPKITTDTNHWACSIIDPDTGATMEYRHLIKSAKHQDAWAHSFANELGRLAQGIANREKGTNTIFFIPLQDTTGPTKRRHLRTNLCGPPTTKERS